MSSLVVKNAVWSILNTSWSATRKIDLENKSPDIDSVMTPWVAPHFTGSTEEQIGIGTSATRYWRERGYVQLLVAVPARSGWTVGDTHAKNLAKLFRGVQASADLVFGSVSPPQAYSEDERILGNWSIRTMMVEYIHTYTDPT